MCIKLKLYFFVILKTIIMRRRYQGQHAIKYDGIYDTDASHGFSVDEMEHFGVSCDDPGNYWDKLL